MNIIDYKTFFVGKDKILHTNLISQKTFTQEQFSLAVNEIYRHKNFLYDSIEDLKLDTLGCIAVSLDKTISLTLKELTLYANSIMLNHYCSENNISSPYYLGTDWFFYQHYSCTRSFWHDHQKFQVPYTEKLTGELKGITVPSTLTYVIYLQVPDTSNHNGNLLFTTDRTKRGEVLVEDPSDIKFSPTKGDMLIFPGNVLHCVEPHTDSTARFVLAGNMYIKNPKVAI